jgi:hypothetical protein
MYNIYKTLIINTVYHTTNMLIKQLDRSVQISMTGPDETRKRKKNNERTCQTKMLQECLLLGDMILLLRR